jgi:hypothetical protein
MEFITITTGATAMSSRSEVSDNVVAIIRAAIAGDGNLFAGWSVSFDDWLSEGAPGCAMFVMQHQQMPLSRCCVCWEAAASERAWETIEQSAPPEVVLHRPRGVPWLAVDLLPSVLDVPKERLLELADAERCVAWALIGKSDQRRARV